MSDPLSPNVPPLVNSPELSSWWAISNRWVVVSCPSTTALNNISSGQVGWYLMQRLIPTIRSERDTNLIGWEILAWAPLWLFLKIYYLTSSEPLSSQSKLSDVKTTMVANSDNVEYQFSTSHFRTLGQFWWNLVGSIGSTRIYKKLSEIVWNPRWLTTVAAILKFYL